MQESYTAALYAAGAVCRAVDEVPLRTAWQRCRSSYSAAQAVPQRLRTALLCALNCEYTLQYSTVYSQCAYLPSGRQPAGQAVWLQPSVLAVAADALHRCTAPQQSVLICG